MARKGWDLLSPAYRARLERKGITEQGYAGGQSLSAARGHISATVESDRARFRRSVERFKTRLVLFYGRDEEEIEEVLDGLSRSEIEDLMSTQRDAERLYDSGLRDEASAIYVERHRDLPDWLYFYHGAFS